MHTDTSGGGSMGGREPDYRALFQACPLPTFVWRLQDGVFRLAAANASADGLLSARGGARLEATPQELHPDIPGLADDLRRCLDNGNQCRRENCSAKGADPSRHFCFHLAPAPPDVVMCQVRDVTEQKEAEALREEMERISRHDLKSPLNIVVGVSNLLKDDPSLDPSQRESMEMIENAGHSMLNLINVSLDILRIERGDYQYLPRPVDLAAMARRIAAHLRLRLESRELALDLLVEGRPATAASAFIVPGDETLCHCLVESLARCAMYLAGRGGRIRVFMDRVGEEAVVGARFGGHVESHGLESLRDRRTRVDNRLPSEADLHNAHVVAATMGGRLELRSSAEETVLAAWLPS